MKNNETTFRQVCQHQRQTALLQSTLALLEWDQQTQLPVAAAPYRGEQIELLSSLVHERNTAPQLGQWLQQLSESAADLDSNTAITVQRVREQFDRATRIPTSLVKALARATSEGQNLWIAARQANDFASFAPSLETIFQLKREQADAIGFTDQRYDALLDEYEPGAKTEHLEPILRGLCNQLVPLVERITDSPRQPDVKLLHRQFPVDRQQQLAKEAAAEIGFDFESGRLDITHHPFCTEVGPQDCRITTRYAERFFNTAFFGTLHEAGHGLYEQGLRKDQYGLPLGSFCSLGIHESQSRLWENLVGRRRSFWQHMFPRAARLFPTALKDVPLDNFYHAISHVAPSLIRVEADEVTYNLHIIIRFELELALINGELAVSDLPTAWNEKYSQYLGVCPETDRDGVLQDIHWAAGLVGYFPTYSLGNIYASQFLDAAEAELGDLDEMFHRGQFLPLKQWLNRQIHQQGQRWHGPELSRQVTGVELSCDPLIGQLTRKYATLQHWDS